MITTRLARRKWLLRCVIAVGALSAEAAILVYRYRPPYELQVGVAFGGVDVVLTGWPAAAVVVVSLYAVLYLAVGIPGDAASHWLRSRYLRVGFRLQRRWPIRGDRVAVAGAAGTVVRLGRDSKTDARVAFVQLDGACPDTGCPDTGWVWVAELERAS